VTRAGPRPIARLTKPLRDRVRAILREVGGHAPKVAVYPPWFQRG